MRRILLRDAYVVTMSRGLGELPRGSVLIDGERIAAVAPDIDASDTETIDARGFIVKGGATDRLSQSTIEHVVGRCRCDSIEVGYFVHIECACEWLTIPTVNLIC
jgi:5-methylthioadenosine/S-adenosylhomocysteine deaminase